MEMKIQVVDCIDTGPGKYAAAHVDTIEREIQKGQVWHVVRLAQWLPSFGEDLSPSFTKLRALREMASRKGGDIKLVIDSSLRDCIKREIDPDDDLLQCFEQFEDEELAFAAFKMK